MVFRRYRGRQSLRPVNRIKHVVDLQGGATAGTQVNNLLIETSDTPDLANPDETETGSTVNGIYLKVEVNATSSAALANVYMIIFKNPAASYAVPAANTIGTSNLKRFVIHQEMVMLQQVTNSNPRTLFSGVIVIPRGYRRQGNADQLNIGILAPGVNINWCIQCHYKEFR